MGRRRTKNRHLPPRMQLAGGKYYLTRWDGEAKKVRWIPLGQSLGDALHRYAELEGYRADGRAVGDLIDRFLADHVPTLAAETQREYKRCSGTLRAVFGRMQIADVAKPDIARYLDEHPKKIQANHDIGILSSMLSKAIRWGWLAGENPCKHVPRNPGKKRKRLMTADEIEALRQAASEQVRLIIDLCFLTALRKADLLKIRRADCTVEGLVVKIQKTGDDVLFAACPALEEIIRQARKLRRRAAALTLFANRDGQPYTASGFDSIFQRVRKKAGVSGVSFHDIRARRITLAAREHGRDYARALASHASVVTTERYIRDREVKVIEL